MTQAVVQPSYKRNGRPVAGSTQVRKSAQARPAKHASSTRTQVSIWGGLFLLTYGLLEFLVASIGTATALMIALGATFAAWAGWMQRRRARRITRRATRFARERVSGGNGGARSRSPRVSAAVIEARAKAKRQAREQRWAHREEVWGRRRMAAAHAATVTGHAARLGVAKVRQGWSQ